MTNSIMGMGVFDRTDPLSYGIVGMHGQRETNLMVYRSDVDRNRKFDSPIEPSEIEQDSARRQK